MELAIKLTNGENLAIPLEPGIPLYVVGPNGSGKSALIQHAVTQLGAENVRRISAHRQTHLDSAAINATPHSRKQFYEQLSRQERKPIYRWSEFDSEARLASLLFDLTAKDNALARRIMTHAFENDMEAVQGITTSEQPVFAQINNLLHVAGLSVTVENSGGEEILARHGQGSVPYSMAQMSDGERNAVILAANVLTVDSNTVLLIDEPERHLHRSIIEPLLSALFALRNDCPFLVSTHEIALPLANPEAPVLIVRSCIWNGDSAEAWDATHLQENAELPEDLKRAILGSRRRILFVEGVSGSLDAQLYFALFPSISIIPVGSCDDVIKAVTGLHDSIALHEVEAYGLIDGDNRDEDNICRLKQAGIYALRDYSVESLYYCLEAIQAVAQRQADSLDSDSKPMVETAQKNALGALSNVGLAERMAARVCERRLREDLQSKLPDWELIQKEPDQAISLNLGTTYHDELSQYKKLLSECDFETIIARYPVRESNAIDEIVKAFDLNRKNYRKTLLSRIRNDAQLANKLRQRIGPLSQLLVDSPQ